MAALRYVSPGLIVRDDGEPVADLRDTLSRHDISRLGRAMAAGPEALAVLLTLAEDVRDGRQLDPVTVYARAVAVLSKAAPPR